MPQEFEKDLNEQDVQAILQRAVRLDGALPSDQEELLRRTAAEMGISEAALDLARREHFDTVRREELDAKFTKRMRQKLLGEVLSFVSTAGALGIGAYFLGLWTIWYWIAGIWAISLVFSAIKHLSRNHPEHVKERERWVRKELKKLDKALEE